MKKVRVKHCWYGGDKFLFRLLIPGGAREYVSGDRWSKAVASEALDLLECLYGFARGSVRFVHV